MTGFGLAQPKQEGYVMLYDNPDGLEPWKGYSKELNSHMGELYERWYYRPFRGLIRKIATRAWHRALYIHASDESINAPRQRRSTA